MYKLRRVTLLSVYESAGMVNNLQNLINLVSEDQISVFLQKKNKNPLCAIFILFL